MNMLEKINMSLQNFGRRGVNSASICLMIMNNYENIIMEKTLQEMTF